jgi:hypothetical protein
MNNISTTGYKRNSKHKNRPYNIIPSGKITMKGVDFNVVGIDNLGNKKIMKPGNNYTFPGDVVLEFPLKKQSLYNRILIKKNKSS